MNSTVGIFITAALAAVTLVVLNFSVPNFYAVIPFWIAPLSSIVSFGIGIGFYVSKHRKKKWVRWVLYLSLFVYIVSISCINN